METQFKGNFHLSRAEYTALSTNGTLTKDGKTYTFDPFGTEYVVQREKLCEHKGSVRDTSSSRIFNFSILNKKETALTVDDFKAGTIFLGSSYHYNGELMITDMAYDNDYDTFIINDVDGDEYSVLASDLSISFDVVTQIY